MKRLMVPRRAKARARTPAAHRRRETQCTGTIRGDEIEAEGARLFIDEVIDVALTIERDLFGPVAPHRRVTHQLAQRSQFFRPRVPVFDELETVGAHRIFGADGCGWRVV